MNRFRIKAALLACLALPVLGQDLPPCTIGGGGSRVFGDGAPALEAELLAPADVQEAPDGSLWISDAGQHVIRRIDPDGVIRTMVGSGRRGFSGDGGLATEAQLDEPRSLVFARTALCISTTTAIGAFAESILEESSRLLLEMGSSASPATTRRRLRPGSAGPSNSL